MTTLPAQMIDRWRYRADPLPGQDVVYWHVLMRDYPQAVKLADCAQQRLSTFPGLHMTPLEWLHMTTMVVGPADGFNDAQFAEMVETATEQLRDVSPIRIELGRVWYHPEAIMLAVSPAQALTPIREAARVATSTGTNKRCPNADTQTWRPHITISYSTAHQDAAPIVATLGHELPTCDIEIDTVSLVIQHGPERRWDWSTIATIQLGEGRELDSRPSESAPGHGLTELHAARFRHRHSLPPAASLGDTTCPDGGGGGVRWRAFGRPRDAGGEPPARPAVVAPESLIMSYPCPGDTGPHRSRVSFGRSTWVGGLPG